MTRSLISKKEVLRLIKMFIQMNSLNLLIISNNGSGRTTLIETIIREYYKTDKIPHDNVLYINNVDEQGIRYYRNNVKTFCQTTSNIAGKKKMLILDDIDMINDQSQQVFRNFIDKYSKNVNFLASCSNNQKVKSLRTTTWHVNARGPPKIR